MRTLRVNVRFRRPCLPHFGHGAFLGAAVNRYNDGCGCFGAHACVLGEEVVLVPSFTGTQALSFKSKTTWHHRSAGGDQREVSKSSRGFLQESQRKKQIQMSLATATRGGCRSPAAAGSRPEVVTTDEAEAVTAKQFGPFGSDLTIDGIFHKARLVADSTAIKPILLISTRSFKRTPLISKSP